MLKRIKSSLFIFIICISSTNHPAPNPEDFDEPSFYNPKNWLKLSDGCNNTSHEDKFVDWGDMRINKKACSTDSTVATKILSKLMLLMLLSSAFFISVVTVNKILTKVFQTP